MNASEHADLGATSWVQAVRAQLDAAPDHADFYALAGEMAATLSALQDGANVLRRQVARYGEGRDVYDDTRTVDPHARLAEAAELLALLRDDLTPALRRTHAFWASISHIGVEVPS